MDANALIAILKRKTSGINAKTAKNKRLREQEKRLFTMGKGTPAKRNRKFGIRGRLSTTGGKKTRKAKGGDWQSFLGYLAGTATYKDPAAASKQKQMMQQIQTLMPTVAPNGKSATLNPNASKAVAGMAGNIAKRFISTDPSGKPQFIMPTNNAIQGNMRKWASNFGFQPTAPVGAPAQGQGAPQAWGYGPGTNPLAEPRPGNPPMLKFFQSPFSPQYPGNTIFGPTSQVGKNEANASKIMGSIAKFGKGGVRKSRK